MSGPGFNVGDVIADKYEVTEILGQGGMGIVLAARHRELDELVALKFLLPDVRTSAEVSARFAREAKTGIRIKNEHVARVLDVSTLPDGSTFMVMEHLVGEDLATVIARRGALPTEEAVDLLLQACEAIAEAHTLGIVHRDLKPANLFLTTGSDGMPFVKVLDFGISKTVDLESVSVTASTTVLGSPLYMSPEQLASSRDVDRRSDVWSLAVILYEMLTGTSPFHGSSFPTLCAAILAGKYVAASVLRPELPPPVDGVLASALALDREARTPSVEAFATLIAAFGSEAAQQSSSRIKRIAARNPSTSPGRISSPAPLSAFDATLPVESGSSGRIEVPAGSLPHVTAAELARSSAGLSVAARRSRAPLFAAGIVVALCLGAVGGWSALRTSSPAGQPQTSSGSPGAVAPSSGPAEPPPSSGSIAASPAPPSPSAPTASASGQPVLAQPSPSSSAVRHASAPRPPSLPSSPSAAPAHSGDLFGSRK